MENTLYIVLQFLYQASYKTKEKNVTFIDEKNEEGKLKIEKFGEFIIDVGKDFDNEDSYANVTMKMGGTFITASAIYCKTRKKANKFLWKMQ